MTIKQAIELFLKNIQMLQRSRQTYIKYNSELNQFSKYIQIKYNGTVYLEEITREDIEEYLFYLIEQRNYKGQSRNGVLKTIKRFYNYCCERNYCINVTTDIGNVKVPHKEKEYLTEETVQKIIDAVDNPLYKLIIQTIYYTGLRISELTNLTLDDVDIDKGIIHVNKGKGNKYRKIPISNKLMSLLVEYINKWRIKTDSNRFFCTKTGKICNSYVNKILNKVAESTGITESVTPHQLRHAFASNLARKGVDIVIIKELLKHSKIETTTIYTHTNIKELTQAVNKL